MTTQSIVPMHDPKSTVLYVDDEETNLLLFKLTFAKEYHVLTTDSTIEARTLMEQHEVKVVISDLKMPEENGIDFIQSVASQYPDTYFVILTAFLDIEAALQAINQGNTFRYLLKPWDNNLIRSTLNDAIHLYDLTIENRKLNAHIQERDKQFFNIFYHSSDGIAIFNNKGQIFQSNPALLTIMNFGEKKPENINDIIRGVKTDEFYRQFDMLLNGELNSFEFQFETETTPQKYIEVSTSPIQYDHQLAAISFICDITERKLGDRKIFNSVIDAEEKERNRLACHLHDGIGPILSTVKMYIEWLSDKERGGNPDQILELANVSINEAIQQIRNISHNLSPHVLEKFGLTNGIQSYIDMLRQTTEIEFNLNSNLKVRLNKLTELTVYRALKECINNTIKHANAKTVYIVISHDDQKLTILYSDNGCGFDMDDVRQNSKGIGLYNIKNRIESLGGSVDVLSAKGMGTRISMEIRKTE